LAKLRHLGSSQAKYAQAYKSKLSARTYIDSLFAEAYINHIYAMTYE